jgi:hypothetical protein
MPNGQPLLVPPSDLRCRFVKSNGARCTMPALRGKDLCFDHTFRVKALRRRVRYLEIEAPLRVPLINYSWVEEHHAILHNLNEISLQLANGSIDTRQASAFTSLQRTCLKTLRQMHAIQLAQPPVDDFVEEDGQPMSIPEKAPAGQRIDPNADPRYPGLSFDNDTKEGGYNRQQRILWQYFDNDPASGVISGLDLNWAGRPADFVPPAPKSAAPESSSAAPTAATTIAESSSIPDPDADLDLQAVAESVPVTPAESIAISEFQPVTPVESTHTHKMSLNPCLFHTYAKCELFGRRTARQPVAPQTGTAPQSTVHCPLPTVNC